MRILRTLVAAGAVAAACLIAVSSGPARAAAPTPPYTAFTGDAPFLSFAGAPPQATVDEVATGVLRATFTASTSAVSAEVRPPTGQDFTVGTFPTLPSPDATHAGLKVFSGSPCFGQTGSITVREVSRDSTTHELTALAISYTATDPGCTMKGEIRFRSSIGYVGLTGNNFSVDFGKAPVGQPTPVQTETFTSRGSSPVTFGAASFGTGPTPFAIVSDTCSHTTVSYGHTCTIGIAADTLTLTQQTATLTVPDNTALGHTTVSLSVTGVPNVYGTYVPLNPQRLLDTRDGTGVGHPGPLGANATLTLPISGPQLPTAAISAVVLNVTVTDPTAASYLTVYPHGVARPTASNLNYPPGWTGANAVTVPVGNGAVDFYNHVGTVNVVADVVGYYLANFSSTQEGAEYHLLAPVRLLDTRDGSIGGPLRGGDMVTVPVDFDADTNPHVRALAVNVTAVNPTGYGFLTTWDGTGTPPETSTLNFTPHAIVPNLAVIPTAPCEADPTCAGLPAVGILNGSGGTVDVVVDIFGFYTDTTIGGGLRFHPITPTRITDTRSGLGAPHALGPGQTATVTTPDTIADADTLALATNVTAVTPTTATYISVWPAGVTDLGQPTVSNLNPTAGQIIPNAVFTGVGPTNQFNIFNHAGTVDVVVDVSGTFEVFTAPGMRAMAKPRIAVKPRHGYARRL